MDRCSEKIKKRKTKSMADEKCQANVKNLLNKQINKEKKKKKVKGKSPSNSDYKADLQFPVE